MKGPPSKRKLFDPGLFIDRISESILTSVSGNMDIISFSREIIGIKLRVPQRAILKVFYNLQLDEEELAWLQKMVDENKTTWRPGRVYQELDLEVGMRGGKCVRGSTLVATAEHGLIRMDELLPTLTELGAEQVLPLTVGIQTRHGVRQTSAGIIQGTQRVINFRTRYGYELGGSVRHPVLVVRPDGVRIWKRLPELRQGDTVCVARKHGQFALQDLLPQAPELARLCGYLVGDGYVNRRSEVSLTSADRALGEDFTRLMQSLLQAEVKELPKPNNQVITYAVYSTAVRDRLRDLGLGYHTAYDKRVPRFVRQGTEETVRQFLRGLYDTDGYVVKSGAGKTKGVGITLASQQLVEEIQVLLLQFGIISSRKPKRCKYVRKNGQHSTAWNLTIYGRDAATFFSRIGFGLNRKQVAAVSLDAASKTTVDKIPNLHQILVWMKSVEGYSSKSSGRHTQWETIRSQCTNTMRSTSDSGITYDTLDKIIAYFEPVAGVEEALAYLKELRDDHLFYDQVTELWETNEPVYDVSVPDGEEFVSHGIVSHNSRTGSVIVSYEFDQLIRLDDPAAHYGLYQGSPLFITTTATTQQQSKDTIYGMTKGLIENVPYFKAKVDKKEILVLDDRIIHPGKNITIIGGHSNQAAMVGKTAKLFVMDEATRFKDTDTGENNAKSMYANVGRSVTTLKQHGRKFIISSAWEDGDIMEWLYDMADPTIPNQKAVAFRLATWDFNPDLTKDDLAEEYRRDEIQAKRDYEGIRPGTVENFFNKQTVAASFTGVQQAKVIQEIKIDVTGSDDSSRTYVGLHLDEIARIPFGKYSYAHCDPGLKRDSFAMAVGHPEKDENGITCVIDLLLEWAPRDKGKGVVWAVSYENVEEIIKQVHAHRNIRRLTFDHWQNAALQQRLYSRGIVTEEITFSGANQLALYQTSRRKFNEMRVILPAGVPKALRELVNIQLLRGTKIDHPKKNPDETVGSKDLADAIVSVIAQCADDERFMLFHNGTSGKGAPMRSVGKTHIAGLGGTDARNTVILNHRNLRG
jgi:intein/homing endonuclease